MTEPSGAFCPVIIQRVDVVLVLFEVALCVVEADGPEPIDGDVFDGDLVDTGAMIVLYQLEEVRGILVWIASPSAIGSFLKNRSRPIRDHRMAETIPNGSKIILSRRDRKANFIHHIR